VTVRHPAVSSQEHCSRSRCSWECGDVGSGLPSQARTFDRWIVQWYCADWAALDRDNRRIWETYYRPKPLFDHMPTWQDWLPEYRQLIIAVQEMAAAHTGQGTWKRLGNAYARSRSELRQCL
jgi:hypothetical protein